MNEEERNIYIRFTTYFVNCFDNNFDVDRNVADTIRSFNFLYPNDSAVIEFLCLFTNRIIGLYSNNDLKSVFNIDPILINYKEQKFSQAYERITGDINYYINLVINNGNCGRACQTRSLLDALDRSNIKIDKEFILKVCDFYDNLTVDFAKNISFKKNIYYSLEDEIKEYELAKSGNINTERFISFKNDKNSNNDDDSDFDYTNPEHEYSKLVMGNIGEILLARDLRGTPYFIHTAKDVGNFAGFDMYNMNVLELLMEVKSTFRSKDDLEDIFFMGTTEKERLKKSLNEYKKTRNEQYVIKRVFLNSNYEIDELLTLYPVDEYTFRTYDNKVYEFNGRGFQRKK